MYWFVSCCDSSFNNQFKVKICSVVILVFRCRVCLWFYWRCVLLHLYKERRGGQPYQVRWWDFCFTWLLKMFQNSMLFLSVFHLFLAWYYISAICSCMVLGEYFISSIEISSHPGLLLGFILAISSPISYALRCIIICVEFYWIERNLCI